MAHLASSKSFCKEEVDWNADAVVKDQAAIAVYANSQDEIVIHQRDTLGAENIIWVDPVHAEAVADAILSSAGIEARKEPMTAAEQRNGSMAPLRLVEASS